MDMRGRLQHIAKREKVDRSYAVTSSMSGSNMFHDNQRQLKEIFKSPFECECVEWAHTRWYALISLKGQQHGWIKICGSFIQPQYDCENCDSMMHWKHDALEWSVGEVTHPSIIPALSGLIVPPWHGLKSHAFNIF